jgi:hypothetical protein
VELLEANHQRHLDRVLAGLARRWAEHHDIDLDHAQFASQIETPGIEIDL